MHDPKYKSSIYFFSNYNISPGLFLQKASIPPAARDLVPLAGKTPLPKTLSPSFSPRRNLFFDVPSAPIWLGISCRTPCILVTRGSLRVLSSYVASSSFDLYSSFCRWGMLSRCRSRSFCFLPPLFPPVYVLCGLSLHGSSWLLPTGSWSCTCSKSVASSGRYSLLLVLPTSPDSILVVSRSTPVPSPTWRALFCSYPAVGSLLAYRPSTHRMIGRGPMTFSPRICIAPCRRPSLSLSFPSLSRFGYGTPPSRLLLRDP